MVTVIISISAVDNFGLIAENQLFLSGLMDVAKIRFVTTLS